MGVASKAADRAGQCLLHDGNKYGKLLSHELGARYQSSLLLSKHVFLNERYAEMEIEITFLDVCAVSLGNLSLIYMHLKRELCTGTVQLKRGVPLFFSGKTFEITVITGQKICASILNTGSKKCDLRRPLSKHCCLRDRH